MQILLPMEIKNKLKYYVDSVEGEISGLGKVVFSRDKSECRVVDIRIFEQDVSGVHADLDGKSIAQFSLDLHKEGESLEGWNLWWHSHVNMGVSWSSTDTGTMKENPMSMPFMVSLVTNKKGEYKARYDYYEPVHAFKDDIPVTTLITKDELLKLWEEACDNNEDLILPKDFKPTKEVLLEAWGKEYDDGGELMLPEKATIKLDDEIKESIDDEIKEKLKDQDNNFKKVKNTFNEKDDVPHTEKDWDNYWEEYDEEQYKKKIHKLSIPGDKIVMNDVAIEAKAKEASRTYLQQQLEDMYVYAETDNQRAVLDRALEIKEEILSKI